MITLAPTHAVEAKPAREPGFLHITLGRGTYLLPHDVAFQLADRIADALQEVRDV